MIDQKHKVPVECPHFGECGGCSYQDLSMNFQAEHKRTKLKRFFEQKKMEFPAEVEVIQGEAYAYRNRMDFAIFRDAEGIAKIGQRKRRQFDAYIGLTTCKIAVPFIDSLLKKIQVWLNDHNESLSIYDIHSRQGCLKYALIRSLPGTGDNVLSFVLNTEDPDYEACRELCRQWENDADIKNLLIAKVPAKGDMSVSENTEALKGVDRLEENLLEERYLFHSQGFFQNNSAMAETLLAYVKDLFLGEETEDCDFLDLYGGCGTFGFALDKHYRSTRIVELSGLNIQLAAEKIQRENRKNIEAIEGDAKTLNDLLEDKKLDPSACDVLVDPPRAGLHPKTVDFLNKKIFRQLVYVSCKPKQLPYDLKKLSPVYEIAEMRSFDLFPQTPHLETVVHLLPKKSD